MLNWVSVGIPEKNVGTNPMTIPQRNPAETNERILGDIPKGFLGSVFEIILGEISKGIPGIINGRILGGIREEIVAELFEKTSLVICGNISKGVLFQISQENPCKRHEIDLRRNPKENYYRNIGINF